MQPHEHKDDTGFVVACYHRCRTAVFSVGFWIGMTVGFWPEHLLWLKVWPFYLLSRAMGMS